MSSTEIEYTLTVNTEMARSEMRKLETTIQRILGDIRRLSGGNESIDAVTMKLQEAVTAYRAWQLAITALNMATGPIGWVYAGTAVIGAAFATGSFLNSG